MNIPDVKSSYKYVAELRERLDDSLKLAQEELQKSQKHCKKYSDKKTKARCLDVGDQVLIFLLTDSKHNAMERTINYGELCGSQRLQSKDGIQGKNVPDEYIEEVYC